MLGEHYTPWNLAVRFDHPLRVPLGGPLPYQDAAVARSKGRTFFFYPYGVPAAANARFLLRELELRNLGGTGMATVMTQVAADGLGIDLAKVRFEFGDTDLPTAGHPWARTAR